MASKSPAGSAEDGSHGGIGPRSVSAEPGLVSQYNPTSLPSRQAGGPGPGREWSADLESRDIQRSGTAGPPAVTVQ